MKKAKDIAVIPGDFDWSDIGAWNAVADAIPADEHGNTGNNGQTIVIDSRNTHIESKDRLVATIGLKAAELLGVSRPTLYDLMNKYGIK